MQDARQQQTSMDQGARPDRALTWALCVPTLNRIAVLQKSLACMLQQTQLPSEVIIVDVSSDWEENKALISRLFANHPNIRLVYRTCDVRSSAVQRNIALAEAHADILFYFDDDTFMHRDCAEQIMSIYSADTECRIAGVTAPNDPQSPIGSEDLAQKETGVRKAGSLSKLRQTWLGRWLWREVLMMDTLRLFVPYDDGRPTSTLEQVNALNMPGLTPVFSIFGYAMTVRRSVALREPFDADLLAYSPCEDTDASYRFSRHGLLVMAPKARLHHFEVSASRLKRRKVAALFLLNNAFFIRKHSNALQKHKRQFLALARRRLLAEFLKDALSRRWSLPQVAGTYYALRKSRDVFNHPDADLGPWYQSVQREVLQWP